MASDKGMELFSGIMERNSKATGKKVLNADSEFGDHQREIVMKGNG